MKKMRQRQTGITFIGWLFLLLPVAIVGYCVIRLTPVYLNSMKVSKALKETAKEFSGDEQINPTTVRVSLEKRFDIDSIDFPDVKTVIIARDGQNWVLTSNYEDTVKLFKNISLLVQFDSSAVVE
jgi:exopolysaccharide biosynthesis protein